MLDRLGPALGLAAGVATVLLAGCGSGGAGTTSTHAGESASTAGAPTRARFVAQAEAVCRELSAQEQPLKARQESLKTLPTTSQGRAFVLLTRQLVMFTHAADRKLRAIARPPGDARAIEQLLTAFSREIVYATNVAIAATNEERTPGEDAESQLRKSIAANSALAATYGMKDCIGSG